MSKKAYSYLRFSTPEQMSGDSFRRQTALAQDYARTHRLELDDKLTFHDLGVSAYRGKNAAEGRLHEFLEAVRAGLVERNSYLLVENLDRISRQSARKALRVLESICDEGITVVTLSDGRAYTREALDSDPLALILSILTFLRANEESAMKGRRVRAAWDGKRAKAAQEHRPLSARGPMWLTLDRAKGEWKVDRKKADLVRRIYRDFIGGSTVTAITRELNREGIPPPKGTKWYARSVRYFLSNPAVIGSHVPQQVEWKEGKRHIRDLDPIPGYFPSILDEETFKQAQAIFQTAGSRPAYRNGNMQSIFSGLLKCSLCGSVVLRRISLSRGSRVHRLICFNAHQSWGCKWRSVRYEAAEERFLEEASAILGQIPAGDTQLDTDIEQMEVGLGELEERIGRLVEELERGRSSSLSKRLGELEKARDELKESLSAAQERRDATSGPLVERRVRGLRTMLKAEPLDRKAVNAAMRALFEQITFDGESGCFTFVWKHGGESPMFVPVVRQGRPRKQKRGKKAA